MVESLLSEERVHELCDGSCSPNLDCGLPGVEKQERKEGI